MEYIIDIIFLLILFRISYIDYKLYKIPNRLSLLILILKVIKIIFYNYNFENSVIGLGVYPLILLFLYGYCSDLIGKELIGFGDIKLVGSIGFYLGYKSLYNIIYYYNIICLVGITLCFIIIKIIKKENIRGIKIPFAPIVCLSLVILKVLEVTK